MDVKNCNNLKNNINIQREQILKGNPTLNLVKPCRVNDGISTLNESDSKQYIHQFTNLLSQKNITFFVPASGSGSRMFGFLFDFIEKSDFNTIELIEQFLNNIQNFSFYNKLPQYYKDSIKAGDVNIKSLVKFILFE